MTINLSNDSQKLRLHEDQKKNGQDILDDSHNKLKIDHLQECEYTGYLMWQVSSLWQRTLSAVLRPYGLTLVQFALMMGIYRLSGKEELINQSRVARYTKLDMMMTSQVLRSLAKKGLVKRKMHPTDTRAKILFLTDEGRDLVERTSVDVKQAEMTFFAEIQHKKEAFNNILFELITKTPDANVSHDLLD